jgi:hypothetical protein
MVCEDSELPIVGLHEIMMDLSKAGQDGLLAGPSPAGEIDDLFAGANEALLSPGVNYVARAF